MSDSKTVKCEYCENIVPQNRSTKIEGRIVCYDCIDKMPREM